MLLLVLCSAVGVKLVEKTELKEELLKRYEKSEGEEKNKLKVKIIKNVLTVIDKKYDSDIINDSVLTILQGDVVGDDLTDAVFVVSMGGKDTVIAVYSKLGSNYTYSGKIDNLFEIKAIQTLEMGEGEKGIIIFRELADQMLGAYESGVFLRAYKWNGNEFDSVFNVIESYTAYWNELWDKVKSAEDSYWLNITQESISNYSATPTPTVYLKGTQKYLESKKSNLINLPNYNEFETKAQRGLLQTYYWSNKWNNFIIGEGTEVKSGDVVAIIDDLSQEPFSLVEEDNRYRIKRSDGSISVACKSNIMPIKK